VRDRDPAQAAAVRDADVRHEDERRGSKRKQEEVWRERPPAPVFDVRGNEHQDETGSHAEDEMVEYDRGHSRRAAREKPEGGGGEDQRAGNDEQADEENERFVDVCAYSHRGIVEYFQRAESAMMTPANANTIESTQ